MVGCGAWYYHSLPGAAREAFFQNAQLETPVQVMIGATGIIAVLGAFMMMRVPRAVQVIITAALILIGLAWMGGFEYTREVARKPYVLSGVLYSTSIFEEDVDTLNKTGVLAKARWVAERDPENALAAGRELFNLQCLSCHTVGGLRNDVVEKLEPHPTMGIMALLEGQGKIRRYMPPFVGTRQEMQALALYLTELTGKRPLLTPEPFTPEDRLSAEAPPFDPETDEYVLLAWNDLGMHCISDSDEWFVILPPANTLEAQLIKRGPSPEVVTEDVELSYEVEPGFANPAAHVEFWKYAKQNFGADLERNVGLAGNGINGVFAPDERGIGFIAEMIPVVPYGDDGVYNPYPLFTVVAERKSTGAELARTRTVAPTSTEMGCRNCHGGAWAFKGAAGVGDETAVGILRAHDRLSGTTLHADAAAGKPRLCQSCHADPAVGAIGQPERLTLSAAIHGWHANFMHVESSAACAMCHPAGSRGSTRCLRGLHATVGIGCVDCHGTLQEHALSLLRAEKNKPSAPALSLHLETTHVDSPEDVEPRGPWLNEPDCLTCHVDYEKPAAGATSFNTWTEAPEELFRMRTGDAGSVRCAACHGSPHALYPAGNHLGRDRDNLQPLQYGGAPYPIGAERSCAVCHERDMEDSVHHANMDRPVRNSLLKKRD